MTTSTSHSPVRPLDTTGRHTHHEPRLQLDETRGGLRLVQVRDDLARVTRSGGEVLGYVERFADPQGDKYRAKRFIARQRRFIDIGEFWSRSDATDCFRFA
jgi:hypothetical protein